jgi:hypothetical protein
LVYGRRRGRRLRRRRRRNETVRGQRELNRRIHERLSFCTYYF